MHEHWLEKRERSQGMSNPDIDRWYETGIENGAVGGKLTGAGGGGFLLFLAEDPAALRAAMARRGPGRGAVRLRPRRLEHRRPCLSPPPRSSSSPAGSGRACAELAGGGPKALVPVLGEPFVHHQLRLLARQGVREAVFVVGFGGDELRAAVGDGSPFGFA